MQVTALKRLITYSRDVNRPALTVTPLFVVVAITPRSSACFTITARATTLRAVSHSTVTKSVISLLRANYTTRPQLSSFLPRITQPYLSWG